MIYTIDYDKHLKRFTVLVAGDEMLFDTKSEAQAFIDGIEYATNN